MPLNWQLRLGCRLFTGDGRQLRNDLAEVYCDLLEKRFLQFLINLGHAAGKYVRHISKNDIDKTKIADNHSLDFSLNFYKINDNDEVVFKVVCNDVDIPNRKVLDKATAAIDYLVTMQPYG